MVGRTAFRIRIFALLLGAVVMHSSFAQSLPQPIDPGDPTRSTALDAATAPLREAFGDDVRLEVERLDRLGRWVFVQGRMRRPDGGRPDYAGTPWAARAAAGSMSDVYVALLKEDDDAASPGSARSWQLLDHAIGPGDVAWLTWPDRHAAPRALFGF